MEIFGIPLRDLSLPLFLLFFIQLRFIVLPRLGVPS